MKRQKFDGTAIPWWCGLQQQQYFTTWKGGDLKLNPAELHCTALHCRSHSAQRQRRQAAEEGGGAAALRPRRLGLASDALQLRRAELQQPRQHRHHGADGRELACMHATGRRSSGGEPSGQRDPPVGSCPPHNRWMRPQRGVLAPAKTHTHAHRVMPATQTRQTPNTAKRPHSIAPHPTRRRAAARF